MGKANRAAQAARAGVVATLVLASGCSGAGDDDDGQEPGAFYEVEPNDPAIGVENEVPGLGGTHVIHGECAEEDVRDVFTVYATSGTTSGDPAATIEFDWNDDTTAEVSLGRWPGGLVLSQIVSEPLAQASLVLDDRVGPEGSTCCDVTLGVECSTTGGLDYRAVVTVP